MNFDPAFALLAKFNIGLEGDAPIEHEITAVAAYLGLRLHGGDERACALLVSKELARQNGFLSHRLESDAIYTSTEYARSKFIREVVENNRDNRRKRAGREKDRRGRGEQPSGD